MTVVDDCTRECLALVADTSLSATRVARELDRLVMERSKPRMVVSDNGSEFTSQCHPDLGRPEPRRMALHRAGQAHAERLHRELQPRRDLALRYAEGSAPAPVASTAQPGKSNDRGELKTG
ncbi:transposase InsO family protein [Bradyrhizobium niftali]